MTQQMPTLPSPRRAVYGICALIGIALLFVAIGSYRAVSTMAPSEATFLVASVSLPVSIAIITLGISFLLFHYSERDLIRSEAALLKTGCSHTDELSKAIERSLDATGELSKGIEESLDATLKAIQAAHGSIKEELKSKS